MTTEIKDSVYGNNQSSLSPSVQLRQGPGCSSRGIIRILEHDLYNYTHTPKMDARVETVMRLRYCTVPIL